MAQHAGTGEVGASYRVKPSIPVAIGVVVVYSVLFLGIGASSGIKYDDWFDTTHNAYRTAVLGLVVGTVFLVAFLAYARWDMIWKDPERLPMTPLLWTLVVVLAVLTVARFIGVNYGKISGSLLVAILVAGVLVGFAEETLFRGVFLRAMREGMRPEGQAALWTAIAFGLFHLPNAFMGVGAAAILQVFLAAGNGFALYTFRRFSTVIWVAMAAHGLWDISTFLDGQSGAGAGHSIALLGSFVLGALGLIAMFVQLRKGDRRIALTSKGIVSVGERTEEPTPA
jgi:uncharacterized protein